MSAKDVKKKNAPILFTALYQLADLQDNTNLVTTKTDIQINDKIRFVEISSTNLLATENVSLTFFLAFDSEILTIEQQNAMSYLEAMTARKTCKMKVIPNGKTLFFPIPEGCNTVSIATSEYTTNVGFISLHFYGDYPELVNDV
jgi:hypothetical protein